jgi:hypothetical protein
MFTPELLIAAGEELAEEVKFAEKKNRDPGLSLQSEWLPTRIPI